MPSLEALDARYREHQKRCDGLQPRLMARSMIFAARTAPPSSP
jgi:hypothetical protein